MKCADKETLGSKSFEPESPYVIVCEGFHDMALVCALLRHHGITNCDVTYPKKIDGGNGKEAIKAYVKLLAGRSENIEGVLVIADADDKPDASFNEVCKAFVDPFKPPPKAFAVHKTKKCRTGVFLTPGTGKTGELENLLLEAVAADKPESMKCIQNFQACCNTMTDWSPNKQAKMKLACYIASHCKNDPCCSPGFLWTSKNRIIDLASPAFQELVDFLKIFSAQAVDAVSAQPA